MNFERLTEQHKDAVYRQMLRVCGNREDAEDVLLEALWKAFRSLDSLADPAAFRAWLAQIARRLCWQLRRREQFRPLLQLSVLEEGGGAIADSAPSAEDRAATAQMHQMLQDALASLPDDARAVYKLREVEELSGEETAERLGITLAAMKSRLLRARRLLRERLDQALTNKANL